MDYCVYRSTKDYVLWRNSAQLPKQKIIVMEKCMSKIGNGNDFENFIHSCKDNKYTDIKLDERNFSEVII